MAGFGAGEAANDVDVVADDRCAVSKTRAWRLARGFHSGPLELPPRLTQFVNVIARAVGAEATEQVDGVANGRERVPATLTGAIFRVDLGLNRPRKFHDCCSHTKGLALTRQGGVQHQPSNKKATKQAAATNQPNSRRSQLQPHPPTKTNHQHKGSNNSAKQEKTAAQKEHSNIATIQRIQTLPVFATNSTSSQRLTHSSVRQTPSINSTATDNYTSSTHPPTCSRTRCMLTDQPASQPSLTDQASKQTDRRNDDRNHTKRNRDSTVMIHPNQTKPNQPNHQAMKRNVGPTKSTGNKSK